MLQGLAEWASPPDSRRWAAKKWRKVARFEVFFEHPYTSVQRGVKERDIPCIVAFSRPGHSLVKKPNSVTFCAIGSLCDCIIHAGARPRRGPGPSTLPGPRGPFATHHVSPVELSKTAESALRPLISV
jgi:hypothetical protein